MLIEAGDVASASVETDVCVVGAGIAGMTLARGLAEGGHRVLVLEGGGARAEQASQDLYVGACSRSAWNGLDEQIDPYLTETRLRQLGGTCNHWGGLCLELDEEDFVERPWIPGSGWPFRKDELTPHYAVAADLLYVPRPRLEATSPAGVDGLGSVHGHITPLALGAGTATIDYERFVSGVTSRRDVEIVLRASALRVVLEPTTSRVARLVVARGYEADRTFEVRARHFVLAAGAIENARLLMAWSDALRGLAGEGFDLVGRNFMEHLCHYGGEPRAALVLPRSTAGVDPFRNDVRPPRTPRGAIPSSFFQLHAARRRELGLLDLKVGGLGAVRAGPGSALGLNLAARDPVIEWQPRLIMAEQSPNPESRVSLTAERDALGLPKVRLAWRLSRSDHESVNASFAALARMLMPGRRGRVRWSLDAGEVFSLDRASHHMGTTRMSEHPRRGVVDANGRVHGLDNLYVAGSSVFPTAGSATPTMTVVALAHRLAFHLGDRLRA